MFRQPFQAGAGLPWCGQWSQPFKSRCIESFQRSVHWLLGLLYGCGHWTGALCGRDYSLLWNTNDRLLSQICFLHLRSAYPFLSLLHHPFLNLFLFHSFCHPKPIILSLLPPAPHHPCTMSSTAYSHTIKRTHTHHAYKHTLWRSVPLSSPRLSCSTLSLTRSPSRIFQWWLLSLSSPRKQRILVRAGQREGAGWRAGRRGRDPNLECGRRTGGKSHFTGEGNKSALLSARLTHRYRFGSDVTSVYITQDSLLSVLLKDKSSNLAEILTTNLHFSASGNSANK